MLPGRLPGSRRKPSLDEYLGPGRVSLSFLCSTFPEGGQRCNFGWRLNSASRIHVSVVTESSYVGDIK